MHTVDPDSFEGRMLSSPETRAIANRTIWTDILMGTVVVLMLPVLLPVFAIVNLVHGGIDAIRK